MRNSDLARMTVELIDNYRDRHECDYDEDEVIDLVEDLLEKHIAKTVKSAIEGLMVSLAMHGKLRESDE